MSRLLEDVVALAGAIGPRGTGTGGERAAADYVADRLSGLRLPVERYSFHAVSSQNAFPAAIALLALGAIVIFPWAAPWTRWVAAILALSTAPLLGQTIVTSKCALRSLLPKVLSNNAVATIPPASPPSRTVVILAHLDTNRCRLAWQSGAVRHLEPLTWLTIGMLTLLGALYLAGALLESAWWPWWVSLLPTAYVVGMLVTLWRDERTPYTPGANDNAASVAVALDLAARLGARPLQHLEAQLAFTGAEEADHAGLYTLLRRGGTTLRQALFVGLEGLGGGDIVYLTRGGLCFHYRPSTDLLRAAERVARANPSLAVRGAEMVMEDEVSTLRRNGFSAICLAGRDPATGTLPHWHGASDTPDTVSFEVMQRAADYVEALLRSLDVEPS